MKVRKLFSLAALAAAMLLPTANSALADPTGMPYVPILDNLPKDAGGQPIIFDGMGSYQLIPGSRVDLGPFGLPGVEAGVEIDEGVTDLGGGVELLEFWTRTEFVPQIGGRPGFLTLQSAYGDPLGTSAVAAAGLQWSNGMPAMPVGDFPFFVYFTLNGVPQPMTSLAPDQLPPELIQPHPLAGVDPVGHGFNVLYLPADLLNAPGGIWDGTVGVDSGALGVPFSAVLGVVGLGNVAADINDIHFGIMVKHVPEPSSVMLLAAGALAVVVPVVRRARRA